MAERTDNRRLKQVPLPSPRVQHAPTGSVDRFAQFTAHIPQTNTPDAVASALKGSSSSMPGQERKAMFAKKSKI